MDFKVAFFILAALCQLHSVDAWWLGRRRRSRRPSVPTPPPQTTCALRNYKGSKFTRAARVHTGFLTSIRNINTYAQQCRVKVYITSSYRRKQRVTGAIVPRALRSNHKIGHAIDMNLIDEGTGIFCNSKCLLRSNKPHGVTCFIGKVRSDARLRWGGDFRTADPVHIDDATNIRNGALWNTIYNSLLKNCP